jgi:hypothetical protein
MTTPRAEDRRPHGLKIDDSLEQMEVGAEPADVERSGETPQRLVWFARVVLLNFRSQSRCQGGEFATCALKQSRDSHE